MTLIEPYPDLGHSFTPMPSIVEEDKSFPLAAVLHMLLACLPLQAFRNPSTSLRFNVPRMPSVASTPS